MQEAAGKAAGGVRAEGESASKAAGEGKEQEAASTWQRIKRQLLIWMIAGPTREVIYSCSAADCLNSDRVSLTFWLKAQLQKSAVL